MLQVKSPLEAPSDGLPLTSGYPDRNLGRWYVLHTKSRQEKAVADTLSAMGIAHFLPLTTQVRYYGKRKFTVELPLFPSYVFLRGTEMAAYESNKTKRIARIIHVSDQDQMDWELRNLYLAMETGASLDPFPFLTAGTRAEVRAGPFRGLQGIIDSRSRPNRLILQVDMLGRAVSLEIDAALLEPVVYEGLTN